jgi:hypothetical protein
MNTPNLIRVHMANKIKKGPELVGKNKNLCNKTRGRHG